MRPIQILITDHIDIWTAADKGKKSGRGRASSNAGSVYGIKKLRELILELAVRGKLVPQNPDDEPASELLKRVQAEKSKLISEGKIKKDKPFSKISDEEKLFALPRGWEWVRFSDYATDIATGPFGSMIHQSDYVDGGVPLINPSHMIGDKIIADETVSVSMAMAKMLDTYAIYDGDIVMARRGEVGRIALVTKRENGWLCGTGSFVLRFCAEICRNYLKIFFRCNYARIYLAGEAVGTTMVNLNHGILKKMPMGLPSIAEQHRIVAKVDELMALCDRLEAGHVDAADAHEKLVTHLLATLTASQDNTDFNAGWQRIASHFDMLFTTEASIDALKQTLLQLAVMGKLVPQDPSDEPVSELLKRIRAEKAKLIAEGKIKKDKPLAAITDDEKPFTIPLSWKWVKPGEFSIKITDGEHFRPPTEESGVYFLSAKDVRDEGISLDDPLFISNETANKALQRCNPEYGDLLIVSRGATVGRMCKVDIHEKFCLLGSVILLKPTSLVLSEYLTISLKSPSSFGFLINASGSTAQPAIYLKDLKEIITSLPPIGEQARIVAKVDELMALCDQMKTRINDASVLQRKLADVMVEQAVA